LERFALASYEDFAEEMRLGVPFDPAREAFMAVAATAPTQAIPKIIKKVMIESLDRADAWELVEFRIMPPNQMQIVRNGWRS